ncbi:hypothetical protein ACFFX0_14895 [Citricoccus parietis]|uniref:Uncharacterized protein n=1 Tax=Citricoccus parietis TaxID=592307 RepID=A0ABV5G0F1_9MICC
MNRPKIVGTRISANKGVIRFVMMRAMKVATIAKPSRTSMGSPGSRGVPAFTEACDGDHGGPQIAVTLR